MRALANGRAFATSGALPGRRRPAAQAPAAAADAREAILQAQERRATSEGDLALLMDCTRVRDPQLRTLAVRALGRLERPDLVRSLVPLLDDEDAAVRAEAANAVGQAVYAAGAAARAAAETAPDAAVDTAIRGLRARIDVEQSASVRGIVCATLGRLPLPQRSLPEVEQTLVRCATGSEPATIAGAAAGLECLLRLHARELKAAASTIDRLRSIVATVPAPASEPGARDGTRARRSALLALIAVPGGANLPLLTQLVERERDDELRRLAIRAAGEGLRTAPDTERAARQDLLRDGSDDRSAQVRYEALSAYARGVQPLDCRPFTRAIGDPSIHVSLLAIDTLARCATPVVIDRLTATARTLSAAPVAWHRPAHALVALARVAPNTARAEVGRFAGSRVWQVRVYAARAAAALRDAGHLRRLAEDVNDNVRNAAVKGLEDVEGHQADAVYIAQLQRDGYELLMTAAGALKGTGLRAQAASALADALRRLTAQRRDTSRDARLAIIDRLGEVGTATTLAALEPLTRDFDPRVASAAAIVCATISPAGRFQAQPAAALATPPLLADDVRRLDGARAIVRMKNGGRFTMTLLAWNAPATCSRFALLARSGYYDGLTFHRIAPNFVVQGGSPGANEYAGDATFWRDEVGLRSNERGTVGLSTRGRDTGDGQFYVNMVDNPRLDHTYTVFARVSDGMDVVDGILEGDTIQDIRIVPSAAVSTALPAAPAPPGSRI